jgi:small subunit ribosomal protein S3
MGQKIHPIGFRLAVNKNWGSRWYANSKNFGAMLNEDLKVRDYLKKKLAHASVGRVVIERPAKDARITIYSARPGVVIGKKGEDIEVLKAELRKILGVQMVHVNIEEIRKPEIDAQLIADSIAQQLEKRIMFRRAMKRAMQNAMRLGAQGIKIASSGRLNGIEIARNEWYREGRVPLHTLRADIDYGFGEAKTTYGVIGIKVWVYKGETVGKSEQPASVPGAAPEEAPPPKKVRKAPAPVAKVEAPAAKAEPSADAKPKAQPRARKKVLSEDVAKAGDATKAEAKVEGPADETATSAAKAKTTVRRVTKKTGA